MNMIRTLAILAAALLAACSETGGFGGGSGTGPDGIGGLGSPGDPTSPAYFQQTVGDRVFFEVDQSTLTASARVTLDEQARWMLDNPDFAAIIEGHADERGSREYNLALGERRSQTVKRQMTLLGVPSSQIRATSYAIFKYSCIYF